MKDTEGNLLENDPFQMYGRVANAIAEAEVDKKDYWSNRFFGLMAENKFLPNTPLLINAGKDKPGCFSACFVIPVEDSMEQIFESLKQSALIFKAGGGIGYSFGRLREEGAIVKSTGQKSGGPLSFMQSFDAMCNTVKQGGARRGAMMGILPVWHPDIEKFIEMKADGTSFSNFNMSVGITDDFMEAVLIDSDWGLYSPIEFYSDRTMVAEKWVRAKELWNKIVEQAHKTGDPGLVFLDTINRDHPLDEDIEATNPCLHGATLLADLNGIRRIDEGDGELYKAWYTGDKETVRVELSSGQELICTPDHLLMTATGFVEAKDTIGMDILTSTPMRFCGSASLDSAYVLAGFLFGDGFICANGTGYSVKLDKEKEADVATMLEENGFKWQTSGAYYKKLDDVFGKEWYGIKAEYKTLPKEILADYTKLRAFLRGLFEANGSVHSGRISYKTTSKKLVQEIQVALTVMGIPSYITTNKAKKTTFSNGTYECKESYDLNIGAFSGLSGFKEDIGFISDYKTQKLIDISRSATGSRLPKVIKITPNGVRAVYDFAMHSDVTKWNNANGIGVHNCGEIPLRPYESCNLGSINLMAYVKEIGNTFPHVHEGTHEFNWDALANDIPTMVRFLDDVIDVNPFPLPQIDKSSKESRKIGLGVMGWADSLLRMRIPYDSPEALDLAEKLMQFISYRADIASAELAKEKGSYPLSKHKGEGFARDRRNATILCVAPTGTISRIAGVSSGIEPVFAWNTHHTLTNIEYDETHWAIKCLKAGEPLPDYMKTANQISWEWHLKMQAAFQKNVDNSISKTINLPSKATVEDVNDIYMGAWKLGLKGITMYRDGSKTNQPLSNSAQAKLDEYPTLDKLPVPAYVQTYRKRGSVAVGPTYKVDTTKGKAYITVNYSEYHAQPVEVFIRLGHLATPQEQSYADYIGRLISVMLKFDIPVERIQKQGNKVYSDCTFWYNKRSFQSIPMLISYLIGFTFDEGMRMAEIDIDAMLDNVYDIEDYSGGTEQLFGHCYQCGQDTVIQEGGCNVCTNCAHQAC